MTPDVYLLLELKRIGHGGHLVRMAPQNFDFFRVLFLILVLILGRVRGIARG